MGSRYLTFAAALFSFSLGGGCDGDDDDGDRDAGNACSDNACLGWCYENEWGIDFEPEPWSAVEARCVGGDTCQCIVRICDPTRCDTYCRGDQAAQRGRCDLMECLCE